MIPQDDISRLRSEYRQREKRLRGSELYSWMNTANLFTIQQRQREVLLSLKRLGMRDLSGLRILEVGCGRWRSA